jgi:hypothetical protein
MELKLDSRSIHNRNLIQQHHVYSRQYGGAASTRSVLWHAKATFRRKDIQVSWLRQLMQPLFLILAERRQKRTCSAVTPDEQSISVDTSLIAIPR